MNLTQGMQFVKKLSCSGTSDLCGFIFFIFKGCKGNCFLCLEGFLIHHRGYRSSGRGKGVEMLGHNLPDPVYMKRHH